jgi:hypothetical protein
MSVSYAFTAEDEPAHRAHPKVASRMILQHLLPLYEPVHRCGLVHMVDVEAYQPSASGSERKIFYILLKIK